MDDFFLFSGICQAGYIMEDLEAVGEGVWWVGQGEGCGWKGRGEKGGGEGRG